MPGTVKYGTSWLLTLSPVLVLLILLLLLLLLLLQCIINVVREN